MSEQTHTHSHSHEHGHSHSHDHDHHDGDTYFIDQLCMVGLSGAFGMICLCLWFWKTDMLKNLLAEQFFIYVLLSGIGLVIIAFTRGAILWRQSRDPSFLNAHGHAHEHDHQHGHGHSHEHDHAIQEKPSAPTAVQAAPEHVHGPGCGHDHPPGETHTHDHAPAAAHEHGHDHHDHDEADHDHGWAPWRYVVILVPIILFLLGLPYRPPGIGDTGAERLIVDFASIIYEAMPFIVLGVLLAGLLEEFVPQQAIAKVVPRNIVLAICIGALLGLVFPMCECGIIVVMKRLLRKGLPLSVCVAYMLAGPVINFVVMTSTYVAFSSYDQPGKDVLGGPWLVVAWRVGLSYLVAIVTALIVDWQWHRHGNRLLHPNILRGLKVPSGADSVVKRPWTDRINNITQTALHDFVDILAFLVLGAILASGGKYVIKESNVQQYLQETPAVAILLMMGLAIMFSICSEADAFIAANFPLFWPDSSKLAFLVLGPMLDFKLLLMYTRVFRARLIYTIIIALVVQVFTYSMVVDFFFCKVHPPEVKLEPIAPNVLAAVSGLGLGPDQLGQIGFFGGAFRLSEKGETISYKMLLDMSKRPDQREYYSKDKVIEVKGEFVPVNEHFFKLARLEITCCGSDARAIFVPAVARESVTGFQKGDWVLVTARIEFRREGANSYQTVLIVSSAKDVVPTTKDLDPYIK